MPWLEWCPDPQRPEAQWVKIFHPGPWTPQDERDDPPPRHTCREWKEFYAPNHAHDGDQPTSSTGTSGTGPQKVTGASQLLNLTTCSLLISTTWPRNHRLCVCLRRCWTRFFDLRTHRLSLLRISLVFKQGSVSSCRIARVKRRNRTNQCVLLGALIRLSLLGSLIPICLQANQAALPPRRSLSSS